jgi:hypothetical protein
LDAQKIAKKLQEKDDKQNKDDAQDDVWVGEDEISYTTLEWAEWTAATHQKSEKRLNFHKNIKEPEVPKINEKFDARKLYEKYGLRMPEIPQNSSSRRASFSQPSPHSARARGHEGRRASIGVVPSREAIKHHGFLFKNSPAARRRSLGDELRDVNLPAVPSREASRHAYGAYQSGEHLKKGHGFPFRHSPAARRRSLGDELFRDVNLPKFASRRFSAQSSSAASSTPSASSSTIGGSPIHPYHRGPRNAIPENKEHRTRRKKKRKKKPPPPASSIGFYNNRIDQILSSAARS